MWPLPKILDTRIQNGFHSSSRAQFSDYSQELIQAVEACVRFNLEHRISPQSLLKRIEDIGNTDMKRFDSQEYFTGSDPGVVVYKNLKSGIKLKLGKIVAKDSALKLKLDEIIAKKSGLKLKLGKVVPRDKTKPKTVLPPVSVATGTPAVSAVSKILATPPAKAEHTIARPISPEKKTILEGGSGLPGALPAVKGKSPVTETKPRDVFAPSTDPTDPLQNETKCPYRMAFGMVRTLEKILLSLGRREEQMQSKCR